MCQTTRLVNAQGQDANAGPWQDTRKVFKEKGVEWYPYLCFGPYLPELEHLAHGVAGVPRDGEGPDALSSEAEETHEQIRHAAKVRMP